MFGRGGSQERRVQLAAGPAALGKELCHWLGQPGSYLDVDAESRWTCTGHSVRNVFPEDFSEGKEHKFADAGVSVLIPGRVNADENLATHRGTGVQFRTQAEIFQNGGGSNAATLDWTGDLTTPDVDVKGRSRSSDGKGYVGFCISRPYLRLWVPPRAYARRHHIVEVLVGVQMDCVLHTSTRGLGETAQVVVPAKAGRPQAAFHLSCSVFGPDFDVKKLQNMDLSQVGHFIKTQWMPQAAAQPERWRVLYVKTSGYEQVDNPPRILKAHVKEPAADPLLEPRRTDKKPAKPKAPKGELQTKIEAECKKELSNKGRAIPNSCFGLFEACKLITPADLKSPDDRHQVVWALRECASAMQDDQLEALFSWIVATMMMTKQACFEWAKIANSESRNPEQEKLYVIIAWIAQDIVKLWSELSSKDKAFLEDAAQRVSKAKKWSNTPGWEMRFLLDRVKSRYVLMKRTMAAGDLKLALFFLREAPLDVIRARWDTPDGHTFSFFHLYQPFVEYGDHEAADHLVDRLSDGYLCLDGPSPGDAIGYFTANLDLPGKVKKDLLISFISACRSKENGPRPRAEEPEESVHGRKSGGLFGGKTEPAKAKAQPQPPPEPGKVEPVLPQIELTFLDRLVNDFEARARVLTPADIEDLQENFEIVLLLAVGSSVVDWTKQLAPSRAQVVKTMLDRLGSRHIAQALRDVSPAFEYTNAEAQALISGKKWVHDWYSRRYFSEPWRTCSDCSQIALQYVKLDLATGGSTLWNFMQELEKDSTSAAVCFSRVAPEGSVLRGALCAEVGPMLCPGLIGPEMQKLMNYAGFLNPALKHYFSNGDALKAARQGMDEKVFLQILRAMVKLMSIKEIPIVAPRPPEVVVAEITKMCKAHKLTNDLVGQICEVVATRKPRDFWPNRADETSTGFTLGNLLECCRRIQVASDVIDYKMKGGRLAFSVEKLVEKVKNVVVSFLVSKPETWETIFGTIDTVIFMIEYMGKEDLQLTYEQFSKELEAAVNEDTTPDEWTGNLQLRELIECVKIIYTQPIVKIDVDNLAQMQNVNITQFIEQNAQRLGQIVNWCGVNFKPPDWDDILEIVGVTAAVMKERFNVLMLPHHTQMITLLMFAIRTCGVGRSDHIILPRTMLGRVGTGEGKSWIIGMLAAFIAKKGLRKRRGLRAHVVIDNNTLKSRDYDMVSKFFEKLGIKSSMKEEHLLDPSYQVVYCTGAEIWSQSRKCQETGSSFEEAVKNCILVVDEVDGLIIDGDSNVQYMYPDPTLSKYADFWLRQLENGINPEPQVADPADGTSEEELRIILDRVLDAYEFAREATQGKDFEWRGDQMYMINKSTGMLAVGWWDLWFEIRYWIDTEWQGTVTYKCIKSILCKKHCFTSYPCIFGLTGSLGQKAEHDYLAVHYDAIAFNAPYFLDTCRTGDGKVQGKPKVKYLNANDDVVQPDEEEQIQKVVELACAKSSEVPVLVIAKDQAIVEEVANRVNEKLGIRTSTNGAAGEDDGNGRVIKLLEKPGFPQRFVKLVDTAMQPWDGGGGASSSSSGTKEKAWRVTVTTAEGGRGHDYRVVHPEVDAKGGLLLILMWVSWSQREWIQFLGRTARQDHEGQLAVYLNRESEDLADLESKLKGQDITNMGLKVIDLILQEGDKKMISKFNKISTDIGRGTLLHKLTSRYWKVVKGDGSTNQKQEQVWRKLCRDYLKQDITEKSMQDEFDKEFPPEIEAEEEEDNISVVALGEDGEEGGDVGNAMALGEDSEEDVATKTLCGSRLLELIMCRCG